MKNNELKDELKFVNNLVQILKKNKLNSIEVNRSFSEFDTVSIKVDGGPTETSVNRLNFSHPNKEIDFIEETQPVNPQTTSKNINQGSVVNSPMVGTVYLQPEPGAKLFVEMGDSITAGQTLLIIEAMKTMNPIESNLQGKITKIFVQNEEAVEFGQPLMLVE